jgi:hypothetical protein
MHELIGLIIALQSSSKESPFVENHNFIRFIKSCIHQNNEEQQHHGLKLLNNKRKAKEYIA